MWPRCLLSLVLLASPLAWAAGPTITSVSGASGTSNIGTDSTTTTTGTVTVFGGLAGNACVGTDNYSTCDSCSQNVTCSTQPLCACNKARIYDNLYVRLYLQNASGVTGNARVRTGDNSPLGLVVQLASRPVVAG